MVIRVPFSQARVKISTMLDASALLSPFAIQTEPVAGWASVAQPLDGRPVWDVVAEYLRDIKTVKQVELNQPLLKGVSGNPGLSPTA